LTADISNEPAERQTTLWRDGMASRQKTQGGLH